MPNNPSKCRRQNSLTNTYPQPIVDLHPNCCHLEQLQSAFLPEIIPKSPHSLQPLPKQLGIHPSTSQSVPSRPKPASFPSHFPSIHNYQQRGLGMPTKRLRKGKQVCHVPQTALHRNVAQPPCLPYLPASRTSPVVSAVPRD